MREVRLGDLSQQGLPVIFGSIAEEAHELLLVRMADLDGFADSSVDVVGR